jgi:hypothetical protein
VRGVLAVLALVAVLLAIVGAAVFGLGDSRTLVPPAESVAQEFMHALQTRRYEQGRRHLAAALRARVSGHDLRMLHRGIEAHLGRIQRVRGERGAVPGEAVVLLETKAAHSRVTLCLRREHGEWRVRDLTALQDQADSDRGSP